MSSNRRVEALVDTVPRGRSVLDIGCVQHSTENMDNNDWVHAKLYNVAEEVLGVDYLETEVRQLQQEGYNVVCADAEQMDLDRTFDVVVAGELIEHLSNIGSFLDTVHDHLERDGELILTTPNPWAFHRFKQALFGDVNANDEHTCWFDETTLRQVLERHGFHVRRVKYVTPSTKGITSLFHSLGFELLGGTSLLVIATPMK